MLTKETCTVRKKTIRNDNFRKCSRCHRFSEIFQCAITDGGTQTLVFFVISHIQNYFKNGKIYHKHKIQNTYL